MLVFAITDSRYVKKYESKIIISISNQDDDLSIFILADGMGGYNGGEIASKIAVESARKYIEEKADDLQNNEKKIIDVLKSATTYANNTVYEISKENKNLEEMGTTLEICLIYNNKVYISHIGDSRVYSIIGEKIERLTTDHSYVEKLVKDGTITPEEAENHPKKHVLIKALGCVPEIEPDIIERKFEKNEILVICSDGLTNMLKDDKIRDVVINNIEDPEKELIKEANLAGGYDNITAIIIRQ